MTQVQSQTSRSNDGGQAYKNMRVETEENTRQDIFKYLGEYLKIIY